MIFLKSLFSLPSDIIDLVDTALAQMFIWDDKEAQYGRRYFPEKFLDEAGLLREEDLEQVSVTKDFALWFVEQVHELCSIAWHEESQEMKELVEVKERLLI